MLGAFNLTPPVQGETGTPSSAINTWGGIEAGGYGDGTTDNTDPKVFVTIVIFDKNYNFLDVAFSQLTSSGVLNATYKVKEAGYAFMYVSNEHPTQVDVYFDDVTMTYTPSNILQANEYYAFGLQTANSWTRDNTTANNFLANGGTELNTTSQLYDLDYRNYDPALARMHQVDPMADKYSSYTPYNYSFNSPVVMNDPSGADPNPGEPDHVTRRGEQIIRGSLDFNALMTSSWSFMNYGIDNSDWAPYSGDSGAGIWEITVGDYTFSVDMSKDGSYNFTFDSGTLTGVQEITGARASDNMVILSGFQVLSHSEDPDAIVQSGWAMISDYSKTRNEPWIGQAMVSNAYSPHLMTEGEGWTAIGVVSGWGALEVGAGALGALTWKAFGTNAGLNLLSQLIVKQNFKNIDILDAALSGISGKGWGQVAAGLIGGLYDYSYGSKFVSPADKTSYQLGTDLGTGIIFSGFGVGINSSAAGLGNAWQNAGGFLNNMVNDGLNTTLTMGDH